MKSNKAAKAKTAKVSSKEKPSKRDLAVHLERRKSFLLSALAKSSDRLELDDDNGDELKRQAALASRRSQRNALERSATAVGAKMNDPREDMREIMNDLDALRQAIFLLDAEIQDLKASQSMKFPSASDIANVSAAVGVLDARVAASAAAAAIMTAASDVMDAWST
jgi:hypothetical protein